jgi:hypothetical protein
MVISSMTPVLLKLAPWSQASGALSVLAIIILPALILVVVTLIPALRRIFGLFERLFLLTANIWILLVALFLFVKFL